MHKRYLDCDASELKQISKQKLIDALRSSEGRILVSETIGTVQPLLHTISNAEFAASQGADLLLLNVFDVDNPVLNGLPENIKPENIIKAIEHLTGRVVGINLEPVDHKKNDMEKDFWSLTSGRVATVENASKAYEMGAKFIVLTSNPGNGINKDEINQSLKAISGILGDKIILIAGKMHAAGVMSELAENIMTIEDINEFVKNGADVILMPAPGTVPGITLESTRTLVSHAHKLGVMTMTSIGTSQEGSDTETIRQIALMAKMTGTDLHHIGDSGYIGIATPENIFTYGVVIRGKRHTYSRIARSVNR